MSIYAPTYNDAMQRAAAALEKNQQQVSDFEAWAEATGWTRIEDRFGCVLGWERGGVRVMNADLFTHWKITVGSVV